MFLHNRGIDVITKLIEQIKGDLYNPVSFSYGFVTKTDISVLPDTHREWDILAA